MVISFICHPEGEAELPQSMVHKLQRLCPLCDGCSLNWHYQLQNRKKKTKNKNKTKNKSPPVCFKRVLIYKTMYYTAQRVSELLNILGLHLQPEITILLAFMTRFPGMFAKQWKPKPKHSKSHSSPSAGPHKGTNWRWFPPGPWRPRTWRVVTCSHFYYTQANNKQA